MSQEDVALFNMEFLLWVVSTNTYIIIFEYYSPCTTCCNTNSIITRSIETSVIISNKGDTRSEFCTIDELYNTIENDLIIKVLLWWLWAIWVNITRWEYT